MIYLILKLVTINNINIAKKGDSQLILITYRYHSFSITKTLNSTIIIKTSCAN